MIGAHEPTKRYGDKTAVRILSFTTGPGTVTGGRLIGGIVVRADCDTGNWSIAWVVGVVPRAIGGVPILSPPRV